MRVLKCAHQDPVVKSQRVTDTNGALQAVVELDPWGGETSRSWQQGQQPRTFTTYERDGSGNDQAMHRQYHSYWMRFDQPDPYDGSYNLTDPQSLNRYSYVQNDPVNFVDPSGLNMEAPNGGGCRNGEFSMIGPDGKSYCVRGIWETVSVTGSYDASVSLMGGSVFGRVQEIGVVTGSGGGEGEGFVGGGGGGQRRSASTPKPTNDQEKAALIKSCFEWKKRQIDQDREKFRANTGKRLLFGLAFGGLRGAATGAIYGAGVGGTAAAVSTAGVGAPLGAVAGAVVGANAGALTGVVGALIIEPLRRGPIYDRMTYMPNLHRAMKDCERAVRNGTYDYS